MPTSGPCFKGGDCFATNEWRPLAFPVAEWWMVLMLCRVLLYTWLLANVQTTALKQP